MSVAATPVLLGVVVVGGEAAAAGGVDVEVEVVGLVCTNRSIKEQTALTQGSRGKMRKLGTVGGGGGGLSVGICVASSSAAGTGGTTVEGSAASHSQ